MALSAAKDKAQTPQSARTKGESQGFKVPGDKTQGQSQGGSLVPAPGLLVCRRD